MISASIATAPNAAAPTTPVNATLEDVQKTTATHSSGQQNLRNAEILEASLQVSIQAGNHGLALLYRTAVDEINVALEPALGPDAIRGSMGQDNSPEATAGRIVALSTAMFDVFAARYPDKDMSEVAHDFVKVIHGGFKQGYQEAENILNRLGVLPDVEVVAKDIAKTSELVKKGYDDWLSHKLQTIGNANTPSETGTAKETSD